MKKLIVLIVGVPVLIAAIASLIGIVVQLLWNGCLVPAVPSIKEVTFLQACGLSILFSILFKDPTSLKSIKKD